MKVYDVYIENVTESYPKKVSRCRATKADVRDYLSTKFGPAFDETRLRKTQHGYSYEVRAFTYYHFTSEFN